MAALPASHRSAISLPPFTRSTNMININYALIVRDKHGRQLAVVGTGREPKNQHDKIQPKFHTFCLSVFGLHPSAVTIDMVAWHPGIDLDQAPLLLTAGHTEQTNILDYHFSPPEEVP